MGLVDKSFKCEKCGYCCSSLLGFSDGWVKGLSLNRNEKSLFDKNHVFPQWAIGVKRPDYVYMYQLSLAVCPYLTKNNACSIYNKRPLKCRCYPFELIGYDSNNKENIVLTIECSKLNSMGEDRLDSVPKECYELYLHVLREVNEHASEGTNFWFFDLATKKWNLRK
jgi:Fe-S-cluster containining protein